MTNIDLINLRQKRNWSQKQLADYLGVDQATVSRWENGYSIRGPALKMIEILSSSQQPNDGEATQISAASC